MSALSDAGVGVPLRYRDGELTVQARPSQVSAGQLHALRRHKAELLPLLAAFGTAMVAIRPATPVPPPAAPPPFRPPRWPDLDALRQAYGDAQGGEAKRAMVVAWAAAAGGRVKGDVLRFPGDLLNSLTLATLKTYARCVGLTVGEPFARRCAWCPNPAMPGDPLCEHCAWLSGRPLPPFVERERKVLFP